MYKVDFEDGAYLVVRLSDMKTIGGLYKSADDARYQAMVLARDNNDTTFSVFQHDGSYYWDDEQ